MSTEERMQAYIQKTNMPDNHCRYVMFFSEMQALYQMVARGLVFDAIVLAFELGRAKVYRLAKKEAAHE